jgi:hypothetical protein
VIAVKPEGFESPVTLNGGRDTGPGRNTGKRGD